MTAATISWTAATDNVAVTGYEIYRDGTLLTTVTTGLNYTNTGLTLDTSYVYTVKAKDAAGNRSEPSTALTVRTSQTSTVPVPTVTTPASIQTGSTVSLTGGKKAAGASILLSSDNGAHWSEIVAANTSTSWTSPSVALVTGVNNFKIKARVTSADGITVTDSAVVTLSTITCIKPSVTAPPAVATDSTITLTGSKAANTRLYLTLNNVIVGEIDAQDYASTTWTYTANLTPGSNVFSIKAQETATSTVNAVLPFTITCIKPTVTTPAADVMATAATSSLAGYRAANTRIQLSSDNGVTWTTIVDATSTTSTSRTSWNYTANIVTGVNNFQIKAQVKLADNTFTDSSTVVTLPKITCIIPSVDARPAVAADSTITLTGSKAANTYLSVSLNNGAYAAIDPSYYASTTWAYTATTLVTGENNTFKIKAQETLTSTGNAVVTLPKITCIKPTFTAPAAAEVTTTFGQYDFTGSKAVNTELWISINGGPAEHITYHPNDGSITDNVNYFMDHVLFYAAPNGGVINFTFYTIDKASGIQSAVVAKTINYNAVTPPTVDTPSSLIVKSYSWYTLSGTKPANTGIQIWEDYGERLYTIPSDSQTTWHYDVTLDMGDNYIQVRTIDAAGAGSLFAPAFTITCPNPTMWWDMPKTDTTVTSFELIEKFGSKLRNTSVWMSHNGSSYEEISHENYSDPVFFYDFRFTEGANVFKFYTKDADNNSSEVLTLPTITWRPLTSPRVAVTAPVTVSDSMYTFKGTKAANTGILITTTTDGGKTYTAVAGSPADSSTTWSASVILEGGENNFVIFAVDNKNGNSRPVLPPTITYDPMPTTQVRTTNASYILKGIKPANTSVWLSTDGGITYGDQPVVASDSSTAWSYPVTLTSGDNNIMFKTQNTSGVFSTPRTFPVITYTTREPVDFLGFHSTVDKHNTVLIPGIVGGVALVGGIAVVVVGARKGSTG